MEVLNIDWHTKAVFLELHRVSIYNLALTSNPATRFRFVRDDGCPPSALYRRKRP